ncbi:MAG TPA: hypothetical protein VFK10_10740 [Burkholderiaceae bacterium]|nr:hypothetical protein [Burkholderiaceae bacterium]
MLSARSRLVVTAAPPRTPTVRGASLGLLWRRFGARFGEPSLAPREVRALRACADALARDDPRLAVDLRAAADRHERPHGD